VGSKNDGGISGHHVYHQKLQKHLALAQWCVISARLAGAPAAEQ
jgi:hypothetical protein